MGSSAVSIWSGDVQDEGGTTIVPIRPVLGAAIRDRFPFFSRAQGISSGRPAAYLDSAATTQKPKSVIERVAHFMSFDNANVHRGAYGLSSSATDLYEGARSTVARWIGATSTRGVVFTRGTTEGVNLVAHVLESQLQPGDVILLSILEHHSNIVPWQLLAARRGVRVEFFGCDENAELNLTEYRRKLRELRPKLVAVTALSNAFGTVVPIQTIVDEGREAGALVLLDAAQLAPHGRINVSQLKPDFLVFSGHKIYGPTGIGVLYINEALADVLPPFHGGGGMIQTVTVEGSTYTDSPHRFEAGTPPIAEAVGLAAAIDFIEELGLRNIHGYEHELFEWAFDYLRGLDGVTVYGPRIASGSQASIVPFTVAGVHPHDLATFADEQGVHIRAGSHCAMPALNRFGLQATARASLGVYSCREDFEALADAIRHARKTFGG